MSILALRATHLPYRQIVARATEFSVRALHALGEDYVALHGMSFKDVYEKFIWPEYAIPLDESRDLGIDQSGVQICGMYDIVGDKAHVSSALQHDPRREFTRWHELVGHGVFQGDFLRDQVQRGAAQRTLVSTAMQPSREDEGAVLEREANIFAATAAAPEWLVNHALRSTYMLKTPLVFLDPCEYCFTVRGAFVRRYIEDFAHLTQVVARDIRHFFGELSIECLSYQLRRNSWVQDRSLQPGALVYRRAV